MQKLDPHTLFSIFEQGDEEVYREHNVEDVLKNPYVLIGMVVTGVENFYYIDKIYTLKHKEEYGRVRNDIKRKYYSKIFNYLTRINVDDLNDEYTIGEDFNVQRCLKALNEILYYFEGLEEYEKCAVIVKYTDLLYGKKLEALL